MREVEGWAGNDRIPSLLLPGSAAPTEGFHQSRDYRALWKVKSRKWQEFRMRGRMRTWPRADCPETKKLPSLLAEYSLNVAFLTWSINDRYPKTGDQGVLGVLRTRWTLCWAYMRAFTLGRGNKSRGICSWSHWYRNQSWTVSEMIKLNLFTLKMRKL